MRGVDISLVPHSVTTIEGASAIWLAETECFRHEVAGEAYQPRQMQAIVDALNARTDTVVPAWLVEEPSNPHDAKAVVVWVLGGKVGYLPAELAAAWQPVILGLRAHYKLNVACRATIDPPSAANQGMFGMAVWLPPLPKRPQVVLPQAPARIPPPIRPQPAYQPSPAPRPAPLAEPSPPPAPAEVPPTPTELARLHSELGQVRTQIEQARAELCSVEESIDIQSFGFYQPRYGFESSAQYVARLKGIRDEQKTLIKDGDAAPCDANWTVRGSAAEGKKMIRQQSKLMLRAFNGECDAAIANVRYNNVATLETRITKSYESINKLGAVQRVFISRRYFELKLAELHLVHEHREKVQQEKQEQARIRDQMREEQKVQEEIDRAKAEAEKQEALSAAQLERARLELAAAEATSQQHERLEGLVTRLETELKEALDRKAKAIARAQLTKSGHVYVLSNIGSFGEGVFKIGLTRRLDPLERVAELGDASVPFPFDVHAIIFAEDAPGLESRLHQAFASRRVNLANLRKEYFRVELEEIIAEVQKLHGLVTFQLDAEAVEFRKTRAAAAAPNGSNHSDQLTSN